MRVSRVACCVANVVQGVLAALGAGIDVTALEAQAAAEPLPKSLQTMLLPSPSSAKVRHFQADVEYMCLSA